MKKLGKSNPEKFIIHTQGGLMYKAYSLRVESNIFREFLDEGKAINKNNNLAAREGLDAFCDDDGSLFAKKIMDDWFPKINAKVFISHSHKDEELAICLSGWLGHKLGISSFIDSCVWGYSDKLLKKFDKNFCLKDDGYYSYENRNRTTSHVNMMLATSLNKMIDQCECIIFLNTPNSISCKGCIEKEGTESPWIYAEIEATRLLRTNIPSRHNMFKKAMEARADALDEAMAPIKYDLDMKHLILLNGDHMRKWNNCNKTGDNSLDYLYEMKL
ncbi:MAG: hypothetical protein P4L91_17830 [Burkholderiaceae bacterium]|nr:hypothetical protein [Burkholderiaceae bacterium]